MNEKNKYIKWLLWLPSVIMMIIIYVFSAKPAEISAATSSPIADMILRVWEAIFGNIDILRRPSVLDTMDFIVRKAAHITEYAILAICINLGLLNYQMKEKKRFFIALIVSILYAATDEYHQTFVEGRSGSIRDVGIDSIGVLIGCFSFLLIVRCIRKKRKKIANNSN